MTSEIAVRAEIVRADAYEPRGIEDAWSLAETLHKSGLLPRGLARPEAVLYSLIAGRELGLTATQSLRSLHVVEGKIVLAADLIVALIKRNKSVCKYFRLVESTPVLARYETLRVDEPEPTAMTWTFEQAAKAGLTGKDNWRKYPDAMLRARCSAYLARAVYPDLAMGMYDPDEADEFDARGRARARSAATQPANTQTEATEQEADVSPATPLDMLVDDLRSASTPETIRASYETHCNAIAEMDEGGDAIRRARDACHECVVRNELGSSRKDTDRILGKGEAPAAKVVATPRAAVTTADGDDWRIVALAEMPNDSATTRDLLGALRDAKDATTVLARWREAELSVKELPKEEARGCFTALVARWAQLMPTLDGAVAEAAVRGALASPPDGPKGGRKATPKPAANDAQGNVAEAGSSAGPQAHLDDLRAESPRPTNAESEPYMAANDAGAAAWERNCEKHHAEIALLNSWSRHAPGLRAAGVAEQRQRTLIGRMMNLAVREERKLDEAGAKLRLRNAEALADNAAVVTARAIATGKSETTVRAAIKDAAERPLRKVA